MRTALRDALITTRISGMSPGQDGSQKTSPSS